MGVFRGEAVLDEDHDRAHRVADHRADRVFSLDVAHDHAAGRDQAFSLHTRSSCRSRRTPQAGTSREVNTSSHFRRGAMRGSRMADRRQDGYAVSGSGGERRRRGMRGRTALRGDRVGTGRPNDARSPHRGPRRHMTPPPEPAPGALEVAGEIARASSQTRAPESRGSSVVVPWPRRRAGRDVLRRWRPPKPPCRSFRSCPTSSRRRAVP